MMGRRSFLLAAALVGCSTTDGRPLDDTFTSGTHCAVDLDCGPGRHCDAGLCALDCTPTLGCGDGTLCSPCGRCVSPSAHDDLCLAPENHVCKTNQDCSGSLGASWSCDATSHCAHACNADTDCSDLGRGFGCSANVCARVCTREDECYVHGFGWSCQLPSGVDPVANADAMDPARGTCIPAPARVDFPAATPSDPASLQLQGVWGFLLANAVRTQGIPLLGQLDTESIQHLLVRVTRDGDALVLEEKWCATELKNFVDDDGPVLDLFHVVYPDRNLDALRVVTTRVDLAPAIVAGTAFVTHEQLDLRGAKLAHPLTDPLPTYHDLTGQWDQDHDGFPGLTAKVTGAVSGDLYQSQRYKATFHGTVVDRDHWQGLVTGPSDQSVLGATSARLINDSFSIEHPQADRSYFRAVRMRNDASCTDVVRVARQDGSWLAFEPHFDPSKKP